MEIPNIDQALEVHLRLLSGTTRLKEIIKKKSVTIFFTKYGRSYENNGEIYVKL